MEFIQKIQKNAILGGALKSFTLTVFFVVANLQRIAAQTDSIITDTASISAADDSGPSLANISKNLANSAKELERIRHEEIMSYIYMGLGFSVVIGIAWFTTVLAKKRRRKEDEVRAIRAQNMKNKGHHHHPRR